MIATTMTPETEALKQRLQATWNSGDYDRFSRYMEGGARLFFERMDAARGSRFLDIGCGSGQLALIAARAGAVVTGCDIATNWIEKARGRAAEEGLAIQFDVADAEELPYPDGQFDVVASLIGAMFAPRPELVAAEMTRVCRPGGLIAMANWTLAGFVGQMFRLIANYITPTGMPSPLWWGDEDTVRQRLHAGMEDLRMTRRMYPFSYPFGPGEVADFFLAHYGPMTKAMAALDSAAQRSLREELAALWSMNNEASGDATQVSGEYLEVFARRSR